MSAPDFSREILPLVRRLIPAEDLRAEVQRPAAPGVPGSFSAEVRLIHLPSGRVVTSGKYASQIENQIAALLELRTQLDDESGDEDRP